MTRKRKIFMVALAVFLVVIAGAMLVHFGTEGGLGGRRTPPTAAMKMARAVQKSQQPRERFAAYLPFTPQKHPKANAAWSYGTAAGVPVWRDNQTGFVWSQPLEQTFQTYRNSDLNAARETCKTMEPAGAWSLPSVAEMDDARAKKLDTVDEDSQRRWLTYQASTYTLSPILRSWTRFTAQRTLYIRCIARTRVK